MSTRQIGYLLNTVTGHWSTTHQTILRDRVRHHRPKGNRIGISDNEIANDSFDSVNNTVIPAVTCMGATSDPTFYISLNKSHCFPQSG